MTLDQWLAFIERQHPWSIALGLDRLRVVGQRLDQRQTCPVILVGGTNGKGSTCAMLECVLLCAGYRVGLYSSPHLLRYNERIRIGGQAAGDEAICAGFERVEAIRGDVPLTYFEFGTLAAWEAFATQALDVIILEVGLGGRLDATNLYEADVAVITGIDLDHMDHLGRTRDEIGFEKAGIFRPGRPAICGDRDPPQRLLGHAQAIGAELMVLGRDFDYQREAGQWQYRGPAGNRSGLAFPALRGTRQLDNASCALAALEAIRDRLPVAMQDIRRGLLAVELPGRFQVLPGRPTVVLDVAHNPQAARALADSLGSMTYHPTTWAVFGVLRDKDIAGVVAAMRHRIDRWLPCTLDGPRAATAAALSEVLAAAGVAGPLTTFESPSAGFRYAREMAGEDDRIVAFGSFLTVADVMRVLNTDAAKRH
jgi:dihydrofolate synthase/folylpolyglutamate synthase